MKDNTKIQEDFIDNINYDKIREMFSCHSPNNNKERIIKHDLVNKYFQDMAVNLATVVRTPAELITLLRKLNELRMLSNHAIAIETEEINYGDVFLTMT